MSTDCDQDWWKRLEVQGLLVKTILGDTELPSSVSVNVNIQQSAQYSFCSKPLVFVSSRHSGGEKIVNPFSQL